MSQLIIIGNKQLQDQVRATMERKADGTFLWVALVAKKLQSKQSWDLLNAVEQIPSGLVPLYERMMEHIQRLSPTNREYCCNVISTAAIVYRPLHLSKLGVLADIPDDICSRVRSEELVEI